MQKYIIRDALVEGVGEGWHISAFSEYKKSSTKNQLSLHKKIMTLNILYKNKNDIKLG